VADKKISELTPLTGALNAADALAISDDSAAQTKRISPKDLIESGIVLISNGSIPADKIAGSSSIPSNSVGTSELKDGSVTAIKLANNSSGIVTSGSLPGGQRTGQVGLSTTDGKLFIWDGSAWRGIKAPESINGISVTNGLIEISVTDNGDGTVTLASSHRNTTGARQFLAGPTGGAGVVSQRQIIGADLPPSSSSTLGAIIVNGGGLTVNASGLISIDNTVTAQSSRSLATWDSNGLVQGGSPIESTDLPKATSSAVGAVMPGDAMRVDGAGELTIDNDISAGTFNKVVVTSKGLVSSGSPLEASDIPNLSADQITSGEFGFNRLAEDSVTRKQLADYSISYIQEAQPVISGEDYIGVLWYQESTAQLRMWNGNSFMPVGFGRLSNENLRWGGLVDASTGLVTGVTQAGTTAGLTVGEAVPAATNALGGLYLLISVAGDSIGVLPGTDFDPGDWCLCINETDGWVRIDNSAGGGGGGASVLNDLLDVDITGAVQDQLLSYNAATTQWVNVGVVDGGSF